MDVRATVADLDELHRKGHSILFVERLPEILGNFHHVALIERHQKRVAAERRQRVAIAGVRADVVAEALSRHVLVQQAVAPFPEYRLPENGHLGINHPVTKRANGRDALSEVRRIGLVVAVCQSSV